MLWSTRRLSRPIGVDGEKMTKVLYNTGPYHTWKNNSFALSCAKISRAVRVNYGPFFLFETMAMFFGLDNK